MKKPLWPKKPIKKQSIAVGKSKPKKRNPLYKVRKRFLKSLYDDLSWKQRHPVPKKQTETRKNEDGEKYTVIINPSYPNLSRNQKRNIRRKLENKTVSVYRKKDKHMEVMES